MSSTRGLTSLTAKAKMNKARSNVDLRATPVSTLESRKRSYTCGSVSRNLLNRENQPGKKCSRGVSLDEERVPSIHWKAKLLSSVCPNEKDTTSSSEVASRSPLCARNTHQQIPHTGPTPVTLPSPPQSMLRHEASDDWALSPGSTFSSPRSSISSPLSPTDSLGSKASPCSPTTPERWTSLTVPLKKRWPHRTYDQNVLVTDVTCNEVTVTFLESATEKGFFNKEYD